MQEEAILPYLALPPFLAYEQLAKKRESIERQQLEEFAGSLLLWMRVTLLQLDRRYGYASRRRPQLELGRKRSLLLAEKGPARENRSGELQIRELGWFPHPIP